MGDVARDLPQIFKQTFDPIEHSVKRRGELVELVAARADRHSLANVAADDHFGSAADRAQPPPQIAAEHHAPPNATQAASDEGDAKDAITVRSIRSTHSRSAATSNRSRGRGRLPDPGRVGTFARIDEQDVVQVQVSGARSEVTRMRRPSGANTA